MSVIAVATPPRSVPVRAASGRVAVARRAGGNVAVGCVAPAVAFYTLFGTVGVWAAIGAALAWSYGALAWRALSGRRVSGLLVLTTAVLTCRTVVAAVASSPFLYFLQPIITDTLVATAFLWSLRSSRPMAARIAADFYPVDGELGDRPAVRALFARLTVLWATLWLGKASFGLWLLLTQPLSVFVPVKAVVVLVVNVTATVVTLLAAAYVLRRERVR